MLNNNNNNRILVKYLYEPNGYCDIFYNQHCTNKVLGMNETRLILSLSQWGYSCSVFNHCSKQWLHILNGYRYYDIGTNGNKERPQLGFKTSTLSTLSLLGVVKCSLLKKSFSKSLKSLKEIWQAWTLNVQLILEKLKYFYFLPIHYLIFILCSEPFSVTYLHKFVSVFSPPATNHQVVPPFDFMTDADVV